MPVDLEVHTDHLQPWMSDDERRECQLELLESFDVIQEFRKETYLPSPVTKALKRGQAYLAEQILGGGSTATVELDHVQVLYEASRNGFPIEPLSIFDMGNRGFKKRCGNFEEFRDITEFLINPGWWEVQIPEPVVRVLKSERTFRFLQLDHVNFDPLHMSVFRAKYFDNTFALSISNYQLYSLQHFAAKNAVGVFRDSPHLFHTELPFMLFLHLAPEAS